MKIRSSAWWGPPKKFDTNLKERKISWLELFYDLVYVIAISRITHRLSAHINIESFFEYCGLFSLIFWGWLNGSLYHDLHGNAGLRTRLMTLWQMMIIAAMTITVDEHDVAFSSHTMIAFMVMQLFITYQWWSVGIYDKEHRKYNKPYTVLFLISLALMGITLALPQEYIPFIIPVILVLNYIPPFIASTLLHRSSLELSLSPSMTERLGLFSIIVFGEVVLGVINGMSKLAFEGWSSLFTFALSLSLVFSLWWFFFTLLSNREAKKGFVTATLLELLFVPTLVSLGLIAASFGRIVDAGEGEGHIPLTIVFGYGLAVFLTCMSVMLGLMHYAENVEPIRQPVRRSLFITGMIFLVSAWVCPEMPTVYYLLLVQCILVMEIYYINTLYYALGIEEQSVAEAEVIKE